MEPKIVQGHEMILVGFGFFGDPFTLSGGWTQENEIGRLWVRFTAYWSQNRARFTHVTTHDVMYELHVEHEGTRRTGEFEVFVGLEVKELEDLPVELSVKVLPETTYAVFSLHGDEITSDWNKGMQEWLDRSGYQRAFPYGFQRYDERFKGVDQIQGSTLDVYMPVTR